jgi:hypothetical protein
MSGKRLPLGNSLQLNVGRSMATYLVSIHTDGGAVGVEGRVWLSLDHQVRSPTRWAVETH